jgi:serine O-acetyltransferase
MSHDAHAAGTLPPEPRPGDGPADTPAAGHPDGAPWDLTALVEELRVSRLQGQPAPGPRRRLRPSQDAIRHAVRDLRGALFPSHFGLSEFTEQSLDYYVGHTLERALRALEEQIRRSLAYVEGADGDGHAAKFHGLAREITGSFATRLPVIRAALEKDIRAAYDGDPAARSRAEILFCYPGFTAITHHRIAHELYALGVPVLPRVISEAAHALTGIDIHPGAAIGESFFIDHGTGVVIGETAIIGTRVRLYQGVTLGARNFPLDAQGAAIKGLPRHPIIEDDVVIYAGATILGRVTIGAGSSIGGNVWLTRSVPPRSQVTQAQTRHEVFDNGAGI